MDKNDYFPLTDQDFVVYSVRMYIRILEQEGMCLKLFMNETSTYHLDQYKQINSSAYYVWSVIAL